MKDTADEPQNGGDAEPEITIIAVANETYYVVEGDQHISQLLLVDGDYPKPVLCIHFKSIEDIKKIQGPDIDMTVYWRIHPEIFARLRDTNVLIEKVI